MKDKSTGESGPTMPATVGSDASTAGPLDFAALVSAIRQLHAHCAARASRAVTVHLTLRNWTIGRYIREFEQNGADRASYGARLLDTLANALQEGLDRCYTGRYLGLCRQLYDVYPAIGKSVISEFAPLPLPGAPPQEQIFNRLQVWWIELRRRRSPCFNVTFAAEVPPGLSLSARYSRWTAGVCWSSISRRTCVRGVAKRRSHGKPPRRSGNCSSHKPPEKTVPLDVFSLA